MVKILQTSIQWWLQIRQFFSIIIWHTNIEFLVTCHSTNLRYFPGLILLGSNITIKLSSAAKFLLWLQSKLLFRYLFETTNLALWLQMQGKNGVNFIPIIFFLYPILFLDLFSPGLIEAYWLQFDNLSWDRAINSCWPRIVPIWTNFEN